MSAKKKEKKRIVNLLPQKEFETSMYGRVLRWMLTTFRFIVITVEVVVVVGFLSRFVLDVENTDLSDEIEDNQHVIESFGPKEKEFRRTQKKLEIFSAYSLESTNAIPVMQVIIPGVPPQVRLTQVRLKNNEISVSAESVDEQAIAQFMQNLRVEQIFSNVSLVSSESNKDDEFVTFELKMFLLDSIPNGGGA